MHNMTNTVTYLTDTNHDPHTHYILDEHDQRSDTFLRLWFEGEDVLPGNEIADFREALIRAAMRLNGEDREFLADNGFILKTIPMIWNEDNLTFPLSIMLVDVLDAMNKACLKYKVTHNNRPYDVLSVLEHMGSDIIPTIETLGCKVLGERHYS